jgi:hypothetical protein
MEYRIKIEESNNGEKWYIPQIAKPLLKIGKFNFLSMGWYNIIEDSTSFWVSSFAQTSHNTEQKALDVIEGYKQYLIDVEGKEVKSTTYKTIE